MITGNYVYKERWIHYLLYVRPESLHGKYSFAGGDVQSSIILHELMNMVSKKPQ